MSTKYNGSIETLKDCMISANIRGKWQSDGSMHTFRTSTGGILNWWSSTGTLQFQGKEPGKSQLQRAFQNSLADMADIGSNEHFVEGSTHHAAASSADSCFDPPAMQSHGHNNATAFKADLVPLLRDLADVFAKQKLVLVMVNGVPRIVQEQGHSVTSTIETTPPAHISRY